MTPENQQYYDNYFTMFRTEGWKQLVSMAEDEADRFTIEGIRDEASLKHIQGQLQILNTLVTFESAIDYEYKSIKEDELYAS